MNSNDRGAPRLRRGVHPHAAAAHHDLVAGPHPVHRDGADPAVVDHEPAVHLRVLDRHPLAVDEHVGGQVGGGVEAGGQHAVPVGGDQRRGVRCATRLAPWTCSSSSSGPSSSSSPSARCGPGSDRCWSARSRRRRSRRRRRLDDGVEDLGEEQRVDDVARQLDGLGGQLAPASRPRGRARSSVRPSLAYGRTADSVRAIMPPRLWVSRSPSSRSSSTNPALVRFETNRPLSGMGHERYARPPESSPSARSTSWLAGSSRPAASPRCTSNGSMVTVTLSRRVDGRRAGRRGPQPLPLTTRPRRRGRRAGADRGRGRTGGHRRAGRGHHRDRRRRARAHG